METPQDASTWAAEIATFRERNGLKQDAVAEIVGCRQPTVSRWEDGKQAPRPLDRARYRQRMLAFEADSGGPISVRTQLEVPAHLRLMVAAHPGPMAATLIDPRDWRILAASKIIRDGFLAIGEEAEGIIIRERLSDNSQLMRIEWGIRLFSDNDIASISFTDTGVLLKGRIVRRTWVPVFLGREKYLIVYDNITDALVDSPPPLQIEYAKVKTVFGERLSTGEEPLKR